MTSTTPTKDQIPNPDRRLMPRFRVTTKVRISNGKTAKIFRAENLSAKGTFIRTSGLNLKVGQQIELVFAITTGNVDKLHRRTAIVKHITKGGTGFELLPMTPQQFVAAPTKAPDVVPPQVQ